MSDLYTQMKNREVNKIQDFKVNIIMDQMSDDESSSLLAALHDRDIPHVAISEILAKNGITSLRMLLLTGAGFTRHK